VARRLIAAYESIRDELFLAYVDPERRDAVTQYAYARSDQYGPGGFIYEQGLFNWEKALLARPELPRQGRVLLGGAGGGRELRVLLGLGYDVCAFDPVPAHCAACRLLLGPGTGSQVVEAAFDDLVEAAGQRGVLASCMVSFDLVWLGWGGFSHVTRPDRQAALLESLHRVAPGAPVVLSFLAQPPASERPPRRRVRSMLRKCLPRLGGHPAPPSVEFHPWAGFTYHFTIEEFRGLCRGAGYDIAYLTTDPYPHALLLPDQARKSGANAGERRTAA